MANPKFEDAIARLEEIVNGLEKGDLSLDKSLKMFEEGVRLSKSCLKMLDEAQQKVDILVRDKDGRKKIQPFRLEEGAALEDINDSPEGRMSSRGNRGAGPENTVSPQDEEENE